MQEAPAPESETHIDSLVTLEFPTIPVHGTPAGWLSQSQLVTMTSSHDDSSCDDTSSSLGDSAYEFIDDRSNVTTDDEDQDAMTGSTTSSDEHDFDLPNTRYAEQESTRPLNQVQQQSHTQDDTFYSRNNSDLPPYSSGEQSLQSTIRGHQQEQQETIEFEEPSITNLRSSRFTEVSYILNVSKRPETLDAFRQVYPGPATVTVRQTMTSNSLDLEGRSYKILYVGSSEVREPIVQKIGTALAATLSRSIPGSDHTRPSKFNVVPISAFGDGASPEVVLIDSSGLELSVEECGRASFARREGGNDTITMALADGTVTESYWAGSKFAISNNWRIPDIAIFYISKTDSDATKQTRRFARSFMSRHGVQSIVISQDPQWRKPAEAITLDYLTPHICIEYHGSAECDNYIVRRLPIDLSTFLKIDAGQTNKNLACLAIANGSSRPQEHNRLPLADKNKTGKSTGDRWSLQDIFDTFVSDVQKGGLNRYEYLAGFAVVVVSVLGMIVIGFGLTGFLGASRVSNSRVFPTSTAAPPMLSLSNSRPVNTGPYSLSSTSSLTATSGSSTPAQVSPFKSLSTDTDIASFLLDTYNLAPNKSEQFKVHVLGDCHIVLRPPHWFTKIRKSPSLFFKVSRGDSVVEHKISPLFDGVYALQIPREYAYRALNVSVWTETKPKINERFEVDFGSSWLNVAGWKRATRAVTESVHGDLRLVQASLSTIYDRTTTDIFTLVRSTKEKIAAQKEAEKAMLSFHLKWGAETKALVVAKTKDLASKFSRQSHGRSGGGSKQIKAYADNLRRDFVVHARNRASRISQQASQIARLATSVRHFNGRQLRDTQKRALKMWWKIGGLPKQKMVKAKGKGGSRGQKGYKDSVS